MGGSEIVTGVFGQLAAIPGRVVDVALAPTSVLQHFTDDRGEFDDTIAAASRLADVERETNWAIRDALTPRATALEYSEHAIMEDDPFDAMSHARIFAHVDEMKPDVLAAISTAWTEISGRVATGISAFNDAVGSAIGDGWQGKGGSAALEAVIAYSADGQELQTRVQLIANKVEEAKIALGQAKQSIPRPSDASVVEQVISMIPGESWRQAQHEAEEAERLARNVMKEMYLPYMKRADDQVPVLPPAFNPINSGSGTSGGSSPFQAGADQASREQTASAMGNYQTSGGPEQRAAASAGGTGAEPPVDGTSNSESAGGSGATPGAGVGDGGPVSGSENGQGEGDFRPATTSAASAVPPPAPGASVPGAGNGTGFGGGNGLTGGPGAGGFGTGGSGSGGSAGAAGGGLTGGGLAGSALGGGGLGSAGGSGARGAGAGSLGAAGSRGMMAGGMGGMAGGRGQGDDDKMHETPGYLITLDNGNELIGDLPLVTPPVLGQ
ncbi:hypothetical protein ACFRFQ_03250 [Rhodococcus sp. NPDC056743]|uniref:hypothetical protein n=1 Tax=Rhodococcus sp. NPDC056743 TaxID=3345934 RepID=UPI0036733781